MPLSCIALDNFDHDLYVAACNNLGAFWYVWRPPLQSEVVTTHRLPLYQSEEGRKDLADLFAWASRTDPGEVIRDRHIADAWNNRRPGEEIAEIGCCKLKVDTPCAA